MRSPLTVETRRRAYEEDPKWPTKAVLRILATILALIAMPLFAAAISYTNMNFVNTSGPGDWTDGLALAPVCTSSLFEKVALCSYQQIVISLLYNPIALLFHFLVRKGQPLHPAIHVGLDLLVWGLSVPAIVFGAAGGMFWYWMSAVQSPDGSIDCSFFFNQWSIECTPAAYTIGHLEIAGLVFLAFLLSVLHSFQLLCFVLTCRSITHLVLFVFSCFDLHARRVATNVGAQNGFDMQWRKDSEQQSQRS